MKQLDAQIRKLYFFQLGSAFIGMLLSIYLLVHHTRVKNGIQDTSSFCSFGRLADCDIVNVSRFSEVAGVPLASIGAMYFFTLFIGGLLSPPKSNHFYLSNRLMAWFATVALGIDLVLLVGIQLISLRSLCLLCCLTYVANLGHLWLNYKRNQLEFKTNSIQNLFWGNQPWSIKGLSAIRLTVFLTSVVVFAGCLTLIPHWTTPESDQQKQKDASVSEFLSNWKTLPQYDIPIEKEDGVFGNPNAQVKIVVFSDFQCPFCRTAAFTFHTLLPSFNNKVLLVFKNFPLDSACNPAVPHSLHAHACTLARLGNCAQQKGKFAKYHDTVFSDFEENDFSGGFDNLKKKLAPIFSESDIDQCLNNPTSLEKIKKDIDLGLTLDLKGTPAIYINGRLITVPLDFESLGRIVQLEEQK